MQASTRTGGATPVTVLPEATREETLARWGLPATQPVALRQYDGIDESDDVAAPHQGTASRTGFAPEAVDFLRLGGWSFVSIRGGNHEGGVRSHRGVLHPDEYVNEAELQARVEDALGFSYADLRSVYGTGGRIANYLLPLRDRIDARLLGIAEAGANMDAFGRVVGLNASTLDRALARARSAGAVTA